MGCAYSKDGNGTNKKVENGKNAIGPAPIARSYTMPPVFYPAEKEGDSYHVVALTSSTHGLLKLDPVKKAEDSCRKSLNSSTSYPFPYGLQSLRKSFERATTGFKSLAEANRALDSRAYSDESPETINTWELMEGLEDSPLRLSGNLSAKRKVQHDKSFSFHSVKDVERLAKDEPRPSICHKVTPGVKVAENNSRASSVTSTPINAVSKPAWMLEDTNLDLFDSELISDFKKAFENMSPTDSMDFTSDTTSEDDKSSISSNWVRIGRAKSGGIQAKVSAFQQIINENYTKSGTSLKKPPLSPVKPVIIKPLKPPPGGENKVVLYITTLRGIRKTFEDCGTMKLILRGFRLVVDERDISMHSQFKKEMQEIFGKLVLVPRLFVRGKYIGGIEEIQQLNEIGELAKVFEGLPRRSSCKVCDGCGDVRFVPCIDCDGRRKIYDDEQYRWLKCLECNENGLIRCPVCC